MNHPKTQPALPASTCSGTRDFIYRVAGLLLKVGHQIRGGFHIQARRRGATTWVPVTIDGTALRYLDRSTADRHCSWLNNPQGTLPEWGKDESPNAQRERPAGTEESR